MLQLNNVMEWVLPGQTVSEGVIIWIFGDDTDAVCGVQTLEFVQPMAVLMNPFIWLKLQ